MSVFMNFARNQLNNNDLYDVIRSSLFSFFSLFFFLSNLAHTKEKGTHFVVWFAADIIGGRRGQGYRDKNQ